MTTLIAPHGGVLKQLYLPREDVAQTKREAVTCPSWTLTRRQLCDVKLILNGGFSPLEGFLSEADYDRVVDEMRLADGTMWPIPTTLDVSDEVAETVGVGERLALRDPEGWLIAVLDIDSKWTPDRAREAETVYESLDRAHPGVRHVLDDTHATYLGGRLTGVDRPIEYDFKPFRHDPAQLRDLFTQWGWSRIVAFQTRNPIHRAHQELTFRAAQMAEANLLLHPVIGVTQPGDVDHFSRVRCYEHVLKFYPEQSTLLSLLPLAMRMAGPREAVWHAIIRRNYGCTHFIIGRDHAGPRDGAGEPFYHPYAAQDLVRRLEPELGVQTVPFREVVYVQDRGQYVSRDDVQPGEVTLSLSGSELRRRLREGIDVPEWFSFPEVITELRRSYPPRHKQGFVVLFTGLSGSGKSTLANALMVKLMELGGRSVSLLDGDVVRHHLSSELGFSREHRNLNVLRIGFVASEIAKAGGIALCAPIAPYADIRRQVRELVEQQNGGFAEIYVATPLEVCEQRDTKGLYAKARAGLLKQFTGIDDPYEPPQDPELVISTEGQPPEEAAQRILLKLESLGFIR